VPQSTPAPAGAATTQATAAPTVDTALAAEIRPAYQHYWEVLDDALATLDDSKLSGAMDGPALIAAQTYVNQLRDQNKAGVGPADHSITLVSATPEDAVIHDHVVDHSVFVDPATREPLPPDEQGANTETDDTYYLRKVDGVWKVVGAG